MKDYDKVVDAMYPGVELDDKTRKEIIQALRDADADDAAKKEDDLEREEVDTASVSNHFHSTMSKLGRGPIGPIGCCGPDVRVCTPDEAAALLDNQMRRVFKG